MVHKVDIDGVETDVYTAAEVAERETATRTAVEGEWKPKFETTEKDLKEARTSLAARAGEFAQFRKLSDEQVAELAEKDRIIYENQLAIVDANKKNEESTRLAHDSSVDAAIRSKVGTDQKLFEETKKMYDLLGLEDNTPQGITQRAAAAFGAVSQTAPDLLATAGFSSGSFAPPEQGGGGEKSFADTDAGKAGAAELGIITEAPKS